MKEVGVEMNEFKVKIEEKMEMKLSTGNEKIRKREEMF